MSVKIFLQREYLMVLEQNVNRLLLVNAYSTKSD